MKNVLLLGDNGMLGSMLRRVLSAEDFNLTSTRRHPVRDNQLKFDVEVDNLGEVLEGVGGVDAIVNAIGVIKPRIDEGDTESRTNAIRVNADFPHELSQLAREAGAHVFQIATDCVFSGTARLYDENSPHDPTDVYGKTKSLGEVPSANVLHLRASIIGPEEGRSTSLWEWVRNQPAKASINGFMNHLWNGVTTYHFSRVVAGMIKHDLLLSGAVHLVPNDIVSKADLVTFIAQASDRHDIVINRIDAANHIDRTLSTIDTDRNQRMWSLAGYASAPSIASMVSETPLT